MIITVLEAFAIVTAMGIQPDPSISYIPEKAAVVYEVTEEEVTNEPEREAITETTVEAEPVIEYQEEETGTDEPAYCDVQVADSTVESPKYYFAEKNTVFRPEHVEDEVIGLYESEESALEAAEEYGLELKEYSEGVATFDTNGQDVFEVAERTGLEPNYIGHIPEPVENQKLIEEP